jgi:hypothetical protein
MPWLIFSCSCLQQFSNNENRIYLSELNLNLLNGKYEVTSLKNKDSVNGDLFYNLYYNTYNAFKYDINNPKGLIELNVISKNKIETKYIVKDKIMKIKILKGKIKNGYFVFRRKYCFMPFIFVNLFRNNMFRIGFLNNGNLITDYNQISFGTGYFIFPFYENIKEYDIEFNRIQ